MELVLALAFLIGFFSGLRTLTPPAVMAWAAYLGWLNLEGPLAFMGAVYTVAVLTLLAVGEFIGDKRVKVPRIAPPPLIARILTGGLTGACVMIGGVGGDMPMGIALGAAGAVVGAFAGYYGRKRLAQDMKVPDLPIAILEDLIAIGGSAWIVSRFI